MTEISLVAAVDRGGLLGTGESMPWHLPAELAHFRRLTLDKPVIMGRKTFESIGRPLDRRQNIILSRRHGYNPAGCRTVSSKEAALNAARPAEEIMVIGGEAIYRLFLPEADRIYLSIIEAEFEGQTYFPDLNKNNWEREIMFEYPADEDNPWSFTVYKYTRQGESP